MKLALAGLVLLCVASTVAQDKALLTARDYYNELKAANSFVHYSDTYVCFRDDDTPSFVVISRGSDIIDEMKRAGHTPEKAILQAKDELFVQSYFKGVAGKPEPYDPVEGREGTEWDIVFDKPLHGRILYAISWTTGRYRMLIYALDTSKSVPAYESDGKCEVIHPVADPG